MSMHFTGEIYLIIFTIYPYPAGVILNFVTKRGRGFKNIIKKAVTPFMDCPIVQETFLNFFTSLFVN